MKTEERKAVLKNAWEKAIRNGFKPLDGKHLLITNNFTGEVHGYESWLFDHDFAKALWGDPWAFFTDGQSEDTIGGNFINYLGHLANMAVHPDPVVYLKANS